MKPNQILDKNRKKLLNVKRSDREKNYRSRQWPEESGIQLQLKHTHSTSQYSHLQISIYKRMRAYWVCVFVWPVWCACTNSNSTKLLMQSFIYYCERQKKKCEMYEETATDDTRKGKCEWATGKWERLSGNEVSEEYRLTECYVVHGSVTGLPPTHRNSPKKIKTKNAVPRLYSTECSVCNVRTKPKANSETCVMAEPTAAAGYGSALHFIERMRNFF